MMTYAAHDFPSAGWPVARYRFVFKTQTPICLPEYAGSMLRGSFGQALRRIACMTREPSCPPCPLRTTCPYALIFESPPPPSHVLQNFSAVPNPYVIEPPPWGRRVYQPDEMLVFDLVLFGQALDKLALIVYAWQQAFIHGVGRGAAVLSEVSLLAPQGETGVFDPENNRVLEHNPLLSLPAFAARDVCLNFVTPLRLQDNGKALPPECFSARILLMALARRISLLAEFHAGFNPGYDFKELNRLATSVDMIHNLHWRHWERWSNRQRKKMTLNGLVGQVSLRDVPQEFCTLLQLGQWTHLGKNATFGLGRYALEPINR